MTEGLAIIMGTLVGVMVNKLDSQSIASEFGLMTYLS